MEAAGAAGAAGDGLPVLGPRAGATDDGAGAAGAAGDRHRGRLRASSSSERAGHGHACEEGGRRWPRWARKGAATAVRLPRA